MSVPIATGAMSAAFFNRVSLDPNDSTAKAVEVILGVAKDGGTIEDAIELLGFNPNGAEPTNNGEPLALASIAGDQTPQPQNDRGKALAAYGENGGIEATFGTSPDEQMRARNSGFELVRGPDGTPQHYRKVNAAMEREVPVRDKKGNVLRQVSVASGNADPALEAKLGTDGQVEYFLQKRPWLGKR